MAKPKTTALTKADVSTTLVSPRDRSKALIDPSATAVATGTIEGAWSIDHVQGDWAPDEAFLLNEGEIKHIPSGAAIRVQSSDGWHHCEFPQSGVLHGPAIWSEAKAANAQDLLKSMPNRGIVEFAFVVSLCVTALGSVLAIDPYVPTMAWSLELQIPLMLAVMAFLALASFFMGIVSANLVARLANWLSPRSITKANRRMSKVLRMPRSMLLALGAPPSHLKLVAPEQPMDDLDREIQAHLQSYRAQRAAVVEKKIACSPIIEHAAAMIDEIETRLEGGTSHLRDDNLRRSYIALLQRAEDDVVKSINKQEAKEAESVAQDIAALLQQMDRYSN